MALRQCSRFLFCQVAAPCPLLTCRRAHLRVAPPTLILRKARGTHYTSTIPPSTIPVIFLHCRGRGTRRSNSIATRDSSYSFSLSSERFSPFLPPSRSTDTNLSKLFPSPPNLSCPLPPSLPHSITINLTPNGPTT